MTMRYRCLCLASLLAGCSSESTRADGPPFRDAFRDASSTDVTVVKPDTPLASDVSTGKPDTLKPPPPIVCTTQCRYVRAGAAVGGTGLDWTNAYPALPQALTRGHVYFIADGTYPAYNFDDPVDGTKVITVVKATAADHGTSQGWQAGYGDGAAQIGPVMFHRSYYVLDGAVGGGRGSWRSGHGFKIDVSGGGTAITIGNPWGSAEERDQDRTHITVRHVEVVGKSPAVACANVGGGGLDIGANMGPPATGHTFVQLSHLWLHDLAIQIQGSKLKDGVLEDSLLERNASTAQCHSEAWAAWGPSARVTVRNNIFSDIEGTAFIAVGNADDWDVYNNIFTCTDGRPYACGVGNGVIGTTDHDYEVANGWKVYHNVFANHPNGTVDLDSPAGPKAVGNKVHNNMFFNNGSVGFSGVATRDYNWFYGNGSAGAADKALAGAEAHGQVGTGDPFVDWRAGNYHPKAATSPGLTLAAPFDVDPDGRTRGGDGVWDRGAYEHVAP